MFKILKTQRRIIKERAAVNAPVETVFDYANSYNDKQWDPFVGEIHAEPLVDGVPDIGTRVQVKSRTGFQMAVDYISYDRPHCAAIRMVKGPRFLSSFGGSWRFSKTGEQQTDVTFLYQFKMSPRWEWMEVLAKGYFRWEMRKRVASLKRVFER